MATTMTLMQQAGGGILNSNAGNSGSNSNANANTNTNANANANTSSSSTNNDVDGREGATSPSQIESSHREEVTTMGCTCKKTKCLKLYCQCFAVKIYCGGNCRCLVCANVQQFEAERKDAIRNILSRNPSAFDTKFQKHKTALQKQALHQARGGTGAAGAGAAGFSSSLELAHKLGCKCRKSACMKKYCECYAGMVKCSANCRCTGCKNMPRGGLGGPGSSATGSHAPPLLLRTTTTAVAAVAAVAAPTHIQAHSDGEGSVGKKREPYMLNAAHHLVRPIGWFGFGFGLVLEHKQKVHGRYGYRLC
jgi:hypothetical protein